MDPLRRFNLPEIESLLDQRRYFILHAPRQTGKTTYLLALMRWLNSQGRYKALYANIEPAQAARGDVNRGIRAVLDALAQAAASYLDDDFFEDRYRDIMEKSGAESALQRVLSEWCAVSALPVVLMLDEVDALVGDTLISLLRQLRAGYPSRPGHFPSTVILCGVRDVKDYRIHSEQEKAIITGGSAFNVKAESLTLGDFKRQECLELLAQHTEATGQVFTKEALAMIWNLSLGQPWLVNALAYNCCFKSELGRDRSHPISEAMVRQARETMVAGRVTHLDQLADKLKEERVRCVIQAVLNSEDAPTDLPQDDLLYVADLGLIRLKPAISISNPIYREVIPRELSFSTQVTISQSTEWYLTPEGRLDMAKLLTAFQQFYREHSETWIAGFAYREAGPQILLQAFLQRIVNGGGRIDREYGLGMKRTDLCIFWPGPKGDPFGDAALQRIVIEVKILRPRDGQNIVIQEGLAQTADYMDRSGADEGHLLLVDARPNKTWQERITRSEQSHRNRRIVIWGL